MKIMLLSQSGFTLVVISAAVPTRCSGSMLQSKAGGKCLNEVYDGFIILQRKESIDHRSYRI